MLYRSGGGGWLYDKIKNLRRQSNQTKASASSAESEESEPDIDSREENENLCKENVEILKITVVNDNNIALIKSKLEATVQFRRKMLQYKSIDLLENFPYFFVEPKLVRKNAFEH